MNRWEIIRDATNRPDLPLPYDLTAANAPKLIIGGRYVPYAAPLPPAYEVLTKKQRREIKDIARQRYYPEIPQHEINDRVIWLVGELGFENAKTWILGNDWPGAMPPPPQYPDTFERYEQDITAERGDANNVDPRNLPAFSLIGVDDSVEYYYLVGPPAEIANEYGCCAFISALRVLFFAVPGFLDKWLTLLALGKSSGLGPFADGMETLAMDIGPDARVNLRHEEIRGILTDLFSIMPGDYQAEVAEGLVTGTHPMEGGFPPYIIHAIIYFMRDPLAAQKGILDKLQRARDAADPVQSEWIGKWIDMNKRLHVTTKRFPRVCGEMANTFTFPWVYDLIESHTEVDMTDDKDTIPKRISERMEELAYHRSIRLGRGTYDCAMFTIETKTKLLSRKSKEFTRGYYVRPAYDLGVHGVWELRAFGEGFKETPDGGHAIATIKTINAQDDDDDNNGELNDRRMSWWECDNATVKRRRVFRTAERVVYFFHVEYLLYVRTSRTYAEVVGTFTTNLFSNMAINTLIEDDPEKWDNADLETELHPMATQLTDAVEALTGGRLPADYTEAQKLLDIVLQAQKQKQALHVPPVLSQAASARYGKRKRARHG